MTTISQPIKATPAQANDMRDITAAEHNYYSTMADHYRRLWEGSPCNRELKAHYLHFKQIVDTGKIATFVGQLSTPD